MPDMYDKLGDLLNEALDSGYIPQENKEKKRRLETRRFRFKKK